MIKETMSLILLSLATFSTATLGQNNFSKNPDSVFFHTEDIVSFWKVFDKTEPGFDAKVFQEEYINTGSKGLKGFINYRIESGKNLRKTIKNNLAYYKSIRESSLSIDKKRDKFYESFRNLKKIYPRAVFPDVYFVIGVKNSGGTSFDGGLIIGAEMFGKTTPGFKPILDINDINDVVAHELVHFQQNYSKSNTLLSQCLREGSADFICELIAGEHTNASTYEYGEAHAKELWEEFIKHKDNTNWTNWLYHSNDKSRPKDLGYWIGNKITKAYYEKIADKEKAIDDILNITDFNGFLERSGYKGQ
jgi:hypothetical protein